MKLNNAIVTLSIGDYYDKMGKFTIPLMKIYAKKCNVDFMCIKKPYVFKKYGLPSRYDKFQIFNLLDCYDRICFIDNDVLVSLDSPNIFDIVPLGYFGAANEEKFSKSISDKAQTNEVLGNIDWIYPYFNSGVMVIDKTHKKMFNPSSPELRIWALGLYKNAHGEDGADQAYLNYYVNFFKFPFFDIGYKFNHTRVITKTHTRFSSYFIHYAGSSGHRYGERLSQIKSDAQILKNPICLWYSRKFIFLRWFLDRCNFTFILYLLNKFFK